MPAALEISLLGPPRVRRDGAPVSFDTRKATALLAHLALAARPRARESLCDLLWPGHDPEHARGALRRTLSALRRAVGEAWIDSASGGVALRDGPGLEVDVRRFRALVAGDATVEELLEAVDLFRGEPFEGFHLRDSAEFDAWQSAEAGALRRELGATLGRLAAALAERGEYEAAVPHARRRLALDELHEPAHRELIRLYALSGDRAAALEQYRECVRTLSRELGVAPLDETAALFEQVSEGAVGAPEPEASRRADAVSRPRGPAELPLVGRAAQLASLVAAHGAATPDGRLALIEGEAGIGKTRLSRELAARVADRGGVVLAASCHEDEAGLPYGPVVELLREAVRLAAGPLAAAVSPQRLADASLLLPDLAALAPGLPAPVTPDAPAARARLLEAVASVVGIAGRDSVPGLVLVDDVHAADDATVDVLAYLGRRLRARPLLLGLAWRTEGVRPGHRLRRLASELSRAGAATVVGLGRLDAEEVAVLVRSARPGAGSEIERRVALESEGLPLFVAEHLAVLATGRDEEAGLPPGEVRDVLEARLWGLGGPAHQLLETAAVLGRSFELETLRAASGRSDEETVDGLEQLVGRGLVREVAGPEPAYDFTHARIRALVLERIGAARRRLLHRRVAEAVLRSGPGREAAAAAAQHLRLAGDAAGAAEQHRRAAEHAASVLAHRDAVEHLDAALALGVRDAVAVHERMGDLRTLIGDYRAALASYESAAAACAPDALARIEHKLGGVHQRRGEWERAEPRFAVALEAVAPGDEGLRARILADLSLTLAHAGDPERAASLAEHARTKAESAGDARAQAQAHNLLGVLARGDGRLDAARAELEQSVVIAERLQDASARTAALNNLALVARDAGDADRALALTEEALALCAACGDRHREAALENNVADLHHAAGRSDEAMAHLKRAVTLFAEISAGEPTRLPEIWKLASW